MSKGTLTLNKMEKIYQEASKYDNDEFFIKWWQEPFLWIVFYFKGYIIRSENWLSYWVDFRGVKYLLKSVDLSQN